MRYGTCPKCGNNTVYSGRDVPAKSSSNNTIPVDFTMHVPIDNFVCTTCGYVERYLSHPDALKRIQQQWQSVNKGKRKR